MIDTKDLYDKGSEQCRQYSQLTMQVRTMAQHVLMAYAVGLGIVLSRATESTAGPVRTIACLFSGILVLFALVLWSLNHHYSHAFRRIRDDVLVPLEGLIADNPLIELNGPQGALGPWSAHQHERKDRRFMFLSASKLAWNLPFIALILAGLTGIVCSLFLMK